MNQIEPHESDDILINRFKKGATEAMEKIVEKYEASIFNFGLRMCGHTQDAEDVMQDTFLNAFRALCNFRGETKLKNWLFKIAANACIRKRRRKKHEPDAELSLDSLMNRASSGEPFDIPDWSADPSQEAIRSELRKAIKSAIKSLPSKYRLVFDLRDIEGFSTQETADMLNIKSQSVKTRLHRARLFLREKISDHFIGGKSHA